MNRVSMGNVALVSTVLSFLAAVIVLAFADGLRRWYSGGFFVLLGLVMLINTARWRHEGRDRPPR